VENVGVTIHGEWGEDTSCKGNHLALTMPAAEQQKSEQPNLYGSKPRKGLHEDVVLPQQGPAIRWRENASTSTNLIPPRWD
jgi:hypothetical protein